MLGRSPESLPASGPQLPESLFACSFPNDNRLRSLPSPLFYYGQQLATYDNPILLVPWLHIVKTVYKRIFACKLTNNICVIILVRCCGPHLLFATRLHTSCLGWCRSVRRRTHHVTPRRTRVWRVRRWTTPSQY